MLNLVLDLNQSALVAGAKGRVRVLDHQGRELGSLECADEEDVAPISATPELVAELIRRKADPIDNLPTTSEVLQRLGS